MNPINVTNVSTTVKEGPKKSSENKDLKTASGTKQPAFVVYKGLVNGPNGQPLSSNDLIRQCLAILQSAYKMEVGGEFVRSPEEHIQAAQKYGSFQAYHDAEWTPEKVSDRVLSFSLSHFDQWYAQHKDLSREDAVNQFAKIITDATQKGYDKAMKMLGEIPDDVRTELMKSLQLMHSGIEAWKQAQKTPAQEEAPAASPT